MAIVVSHIANEFDELARRALEKQALCDLIEIRLDRIGHPGVETLREFFRASEKPVIVSLNGPGAFGSFSGSLDEELTLLHDAAEAGARFVDIDWTRSLDLGEVEAPCHRIVSRHFSDHVPEDLDAALEEVQEVLYEGDVTKLIGHATSCEEGLRLLAWLRTTKGIVSFASGEAGSFTRVLAPIFGSPFTYCAPARVPGDDSFQGTAPGQIPVNDLLAMLPPGGVSQETAVLGVVGNPIGHSQSPWVHGMALKAARLDVVYVPFEPTDFAHFLELTSDENYRGFSVTAPFKEAAHAALSKRDEASNRTGAVNTLVREEDGGWRAANTDVPAVRDTLIRALAYANEQAGRVLELPDAHTLVIGAGGAARAAVWAVRAVGGSVTVASRNLERAQRLAADLDCEAVPLETVGEVDHQILVHTTPVGSRSGEDGLAIDVEALRPGSVVLDAVYDPIRTPLLLAAVERGALPVPGGEWFVRQAILQFRQFTNTEPDEELMRRSFECAPGLGVERDVDRP